MPEESADKDPCIFFVRAVRSNDKTVDANEPKVIMQPTRVIKPKDAILGYSREIISLIGKSTHLVHINWSRASQ